MHNVWWNPIELPHLLGILWKQVYKEYPLPIVITAEVATKIDVLGLLLLFIRCHNNCTRGITAHFNYNHLNCLVQSRSLTIIQRCAHICQNIIVNSNICVVASTLLVENNSRLGDPIWDVKGTFRWNVRTKRVEIFTEYMFVAIIHNITIILRWTHKFPNILKKIVLIVKK